MLKISNDKGRITTESEEIQRIIRNYFSQLCTNKCERLNDIHFSVGKRNPFNNESDMEATC